MRQSVATWLAFLWLPVLVGQTGCGAIDGGPVGTGIAASVVGNVIAVEDFDQPESTESMDPPPTGLTTDAEDEPTETIESVGGIEVSLSGFPGLQTTTDAEGNFRLDGEFSGPVTLRFTAPEIDVEQPLEVPSGGIVVLSDIELGSEGAIIDGGEQLGVVGRVLDVDCGLGWLRIQDRGDNLFDALLLEETTILRGEQEASCDDIERNSQISLEGILEDLESRSVTALEIQLEPDGAPSPTERGVRFVGSLVVIDCQAGSAVVAQGKNRRRLAITPDTTILRAPQGPIACEDLLLGQWVQGKGTVNLERPNRARAETIIVRRSPEPGARLPIRGFLAARNCAASTLEVSDGAALLTVRILPSTQISPKVRCADLTVGSSVRGFGVVSEDLPGALDARSLNFRRVRDR